MTPKEQLPLDINRATKPKRRKRAHHLLTEDEGARLSHAVRQFMIENKVPQRELAARGQCSETVISLLLQNVRMPSRRVGQSLMYVLGKSQMAFGDLPLPQEIGNIAANDQAPAAGQALEVVAAAADAPEKDPGHAPPSISNVYVAAAVSQTPAIDRISGLLSIDENLRLSHAIKQFMQRHQLRLVDLAPKADCSAGSIGSCVLGTRYPSRRLARRILAAIGLPEDTRIADLPLPPAAPPEPTAAPHHPLAAQPHQDLVRPVGASTSDPLDVACTIDRVQGRAAAMSFLEAVLNGRQGVRG